jgi:hypothetical protein
MESLLDKAVQSALQAEIAFTKFITVNDIDSIEGHKPGYHIQKNAWPLFFNKEGKKGIDSSKSITIKWQDDFETLCRFIYYGVDKRDEYRLTFIDKDFPFLKDENIGSLLVISKKSNGYYEAFVLEADKEIDDFLGICNVLLIDTNGVIF